MPSEITPVRVEIRYANPAPAQRPALIRGCRTRHKQQRVSPRQVSTALVRTVSGRPLRTGACGTRSKAGRFTGINTKGGRTRRSESPCQSNPAEGGGPTEPPNPNADHGDDLIYWRYLPFVLTSRA